MSEKNTGDWYYDSGRHLEDLEKDLAGRLHRLAELRDMNAHPDMISAAEQAVKDAKANLKQHGAGQKSKRPSRPAEQRG